MGHVKYFALGWLLGLLLAPAAGAELRRQLLDLVRSRAGLG